MQSDADRKESRARLAAVALAGGATVRDTAAAAGLSESSVYRLLRRPEFNRRVAAIRDAVLSAALGKLLQSTTKAAETLAALLADDDPKIRLAAASRLLSLTSHLREHVDAESRLRALENQLPPGNS